MGTAMNLNEEIEVLCPLILFFIKLLPQMLGNVAHRSTYFHFTFSEK
jgi:hypothetical protein